jgi:hypothetical protein
MNCHQLEIPHPEEFTEFHAQTGRENEAVCRNCHVFPELCSNCHHAGSSATEPWQVVHPRTVSEQGAEGCLETCHDKAFCVNCHTATNAVPTSHTVPDWTRRQALTTPAKHPEAYEQNADSCTYCHGEGSPTENAFCNGCHQLEMPHPGEFKDSHGPDIAEGALNRAVCANCHSPVFCNNCHHEGAVGDVPWQQEHPGIVQETGAEPCFECHDPTYCAQCHVSLGR